MQYPTYEQIVSNIRALIEQKGMKQAVVAHRSGFDVQEFSNMLNQKRKLIRIEYLPAIACALGVGLNDLFYLPGKKAVEQEGNLSKVATWQLVKELETREGIQREYAEPHEKKALFVDGPAIILTVID